VFARRCGAAPLHGPSHAANARPAQPLRSQRSPRAAPCAGTRFRFAFDERDGCFHVACTAAAPGAAPGAARTPSNFALLCSHPACSDLSEQTLSQKQSSPGPRPLQKIGEAEELRLIPRAHIAELVADAQRWHAASRASS